MKTILFFLSILLFACSKAPVQPVISGTVLFAGDTTKAVKYAIVEAVSAGASYQAQVKPNGGYSIEVEPGTYLVRAYKRTDTLNGIDHDDAVLIQQHLIAVATFSQWQKFAADVNQSGAATSHDCWVVNSAVLGQTESRKVIGGWWTFCPADYVAPQTDGFFIPAYPTSKTADVQDNTEVNFIGFRRGDANLSANPEQ